MRQPRLHWNVDLQACAERDENDMDVAVPNATPRIFALGEPMPLVFGLLADDDMCNMFRYFISQADLPKLP